MFCRNCGSQLPDGAAFCGNCGTKVEVQAAPQQPAYQAPQQHTYTATAPQPTPVVAPARPQADPELSSMATNAMIFGIVGAATGVAIGVPGIIFSILTKNKVSEYLSRGGQLSGKAKVANILSKVGLPVSIVCTAIYTLSFFIGFLSAL